MALSLDGAPDEVFIHPAIGHYVQSNFYLRRMRVGAYRINKVDDHEEEVVRYGFFG